MIHPALSLLVLSGPALPARPMESPASAHQVFDRAVTLLTSEHPAPYAALSRPAFEEVVSRVRRDLAEDASDTALALAVMRVVHLVAEGHTLLLVQGSEPADLDYPVRFALEGGELRVRALHEPEDRGALGALAGRVSELGGQSLEEVVQRALPYCAGDNEHHGRKLSLPRILRSPRFAMELGFADEDGVLEVTLEGLDGGRMQLELVPGPPLGNDEEGWVHWSLPQGPAAPVYLRNPRAPHWVTTLPGSNAVYAQYNQVNQGEPSTEAFAASIEAELAESGSERLVVDVRRNGGGNNFMNPPILHALLKSRVNRPGGLFVLTSPNTFSACVNFCGWLERETHALFVGEPTGAPPNMHGDAQSFELGRQGWVLRISEWSWHESMPWDGRAYIRPRIEARTTIPDLLAGRDPVLEAALAFDDPELVERLQGTAPRTHYADPWQQPAVDARRSWPRR